MNCLHSKVRRIEGVTLDTFAVDNLICPIVHFEGLHEWGDDVALFFL